MKNVLSREALAELARVYLKSPYIRAPQWDLMEKRWVSISPHGTATSSCGVPHFTGIPKTDTDIQRHQRRLWQRCQRCHLIRPWGGCFRHATPYGKSYFPGGHR